MRNRQCLCGFAQAYIAQIAQAIRIAPISVRTAHKLRRFRALALCAKRRAQTAPGDPD